MQLQDCHIICDLNANNPYFGGLKSWENNNQQNAEKFKPEELVWAAWSADAVGGGINDFKQLIIMLTLKIK